MSTVTAAALVTACGVPGTEPPQANFSRHAEASKGRNTGKTITTGTSSWVTSSSRLACTGNGGTGERRGYDSRLTQQH
jgi:hypothetical protein